MPSEATLRLTGGGDVVRLAADLELAIQPTAADMLAALEWKRARVLELAAQGLDFEGRPFAPYSEKSPYTWYPAGRHSKGRTAKSRMDAAKRMRRKLGAGTVTAGGGIRFASYAEFKLSLGRSGVDLTGPSAPHMLQELVTRVIGPLEGRLGIYSADKAEIAEYHNEGTPRMPRRRFLDTSAADVTTMSEILASRAEARLAKLSK